MNILTFDIEEWYLEKVMHDGGRPFRYKLLNDVFTRVLDELDKYNIKATFFCVGGLAREFPEVVRTIASRGHEIGCHSNEHTWINKMDENSFRTDTMEALKVLQDVSGQTVKAYRAPAFSITTQNNWAFGVLSECGITCDASIFPTNRDFGGYKGFPQDSPCIISYEGVELKEFPISLTKIYGKTTAYSGGGFFRLFPFWFVRKAMKEKDYNICYFHMNDIIAQKKTFLSKNEYEEFFKEPGTLKNRIVRYLKSNIGSSSAFEKFKCLLASDSFISIDTAEKTMNWEKTKKINLSALDSDINK